MNSKNNTYDKKSLVTEIEYSISGRARKQAVKSGFPDFGNIINPKQIAAPVRERRNQGKRAGVLWIGVNVSI